MARHDKYSLRDLRKDFPTDRACLEFIFETLHSYKCSCGGEYVLITGRRQFQCSQCRFQIAPTANTIFHKSDTPLTLWFNAILAFSNAKSGISAKQMERHLGVTYKTAWRILHLIRKALAQDNDKLKGIVEMDEAYFGGRHYGGINNEGLARAMSAKTAVIAAVERRGKLKAYVVPRVQAKELGNFLENNVEKGSFLMTDKTNRLNKVTGGYDRHSVNHGKGEYARGIIHVNSVENFWSHVKRSMKGTFKRVSKQHLQTYVDGFVFHWNTRHNDMARFAVLLDTVLHASVDLKKQASS